MKKMALSGIVGLAILFATAAQGAQKTGIYATGSGAWTSVSDDLELTDLDGDNTGSLPDQSLSLDNGYAITAAVGYDFGQFRAEGEIGYRSNDVDELQIGGVRSSGSADFEAFSIMANAIVDIPLGDKFFLYGGVGAGVVVADISTNTALYDTDVVAAAVAFQLMVGAGVNLNDQTSLYVGYRLFSAFDSSFDNEDIDDSSNDELEGDMNFPVFHSVEIGLRYIF